MQILRARWQRTMSDKPYGKGVRWGLDLFERSEPLSQTLQELFTIFFPGKKFLGPVPTEDGNLSFPVEVEGGGTHDINDLSSGEKGSVYLDICACGIQPQNTRLFCWMNQNCI